MDLLECKSPGLSPIGKVQLREHQTSNGEERKGPRKCKGGAGQQGEGLPSSMEKKDPRSGGERTQFLSQNPRHLSGHLSRALLTYEPGLPTPLLQTLLSHLWRDECNSIARRCLRIAFLAFVRSKLHEPRRYLPGLIPSPAPATSESLYPSLK